MIQPLELHEMNLLELYEKLRMSDNDFERWMTNLGLLHSSMLCDNCQQPMIDRMQGRNRYWICDHILGWVDPTLAYVCYPGDT